MLPRSIQTVILITFLFIVHWNGKRVWCYEEFELNNVGVVAGKELIFSHIIFRHGDRNPISFYAKDPFKDVAYYREGLGKLTDEGKQRLFELGKYLRRRYRNLLNDRPYSPDLIYVQSSDVQRTRESAAAAMDGFFGRKKRATCNFFESLFSLCDETLRSVPVNVIPKKLDNLIRFIDAECPRYQHELAKVVNSARPYVTQRYQKLFEYLEEHTGQTVKDLIDVYDIHDTLFTEKSKNFPMPDWTKEVFHPGNFSRDMKGAVRQFFKWGTETKPMARLRSGFLIREMLQRFTAKSQSHLSPNYSFHVYSGHDGTMFSLLNTLKLFEMKLVPYGACILFELYKPDEGDYYVQLFYKNTTAEVIFPIYIPNCGTKCSLEKFHSIYQDVIPTKDFERECRIY